MARALSRQEKRALWEGWKGGLTLAQIAEGLERSISAVHCHVRERGGVAPRPARRAQRALKGAEREGRLASLAPRSPRHKETI